MAQYYDKLTFSDYPPTELLGSGIYNDSIKRLSFQYRTRNEEKLIAYIALSQDKPNIEIPNVENQINDCSFVPTSILLPKFNPIVKNSHKDTFLKPSDIERIKRFVILNYYILTSLATDKSFNYEKQFLPYIIKLGKGEGYIIPQERFADNTNHTIYISCSVTDDRLWFMTNDNNQNTEHLMIEIENTEPFEFFDKYTAYVDLNKHRDVVANIFNMGEIIKKNCNKL